MTSRRQFVRSASAGSLALATAHAQQLVAWNAEWDRALLQASLRRMNANFDEAERMLRATVGPEYRYHSALRSQVVHPTRESLHYALLLLEEGSETSRERAFGVMERLLALQETDPSSKWYGLWGWYLEEPAPQMQPADWNWADFLGSILILIWHRHRQRLPATLATGLKQSLAHAAESIIRRNVRMGYTNIAIKGTFVTLAAGELLDDARLRAYGKERLTRFCREVDRTGSFNEYNSPTYNRVGLENLTRMRMVWRDQDAAAVAARVEHRMWDHFSRRWHVATRQLAGPMSRCYSTDIGHPLWLQKALRNRLLFVPLETLRQGDAASDPEASYIDFRCPEALVSRFLEPGPTRTVREIFLAPSAASTLPTQGTTWLDGARSLGSVNQGDFWVQRRPLLSYWRTASGEPGWALLRVIKDDYDFASARFYSVQHEGEVLAVANFQSPGGDRHLSLDPVEGGKFQAKTMRLQVDLHGVDTAAISVSATDLGEISAAPSIRIPVAGGVLRFTLLGQHFDGQRKSFRLVKTSSSAAMLVFSWWDANEPVSVDWANPCEAWAAFHLGWESANTKTGTGTGEKASLGTASDGVIDVTWTSPRTALSLRAGRTVASASEQDRRFDGGHIQGREVLLQRLSDTRLAPSP